METTESISEPRRLTRPTGERWLGGVAAGLGAYFDLNPTIYRIAFVVLALAGGTGVLLYIVAWLVVPEEGTADSIAGGELRKHRDQPRRLIGLAILALAAIFALSEAHIWPSPGNLWVAVALGIAAIAWLRVGPATPGRRRIVVASLLGVAALVVVALMLVVPVNLFAGIGNRSDTPAVASEIHSKYSLGIGKLALDFSHVQLPKGETFVKAKVGVGDLHIVVPQNATVDVRGQAQVGDVDLLGQRDDGTHVHSHLVKRTGSGRVLVLDARTGIGQVVVARG